MELVPRLGGKNTMWMTPLVERLREYRPPYWALRLLPGTSRSFGPPRKMVSLAAPGVTLMEAKKAPSIVFADPVFHNSPDPYWLNCPKCHTPVHPYVIDAGRARLLFPGSWVVVGRDTFLYDTSFWGHPNFASARRWHPIFRRKLNRRGSKRITGRVLSLASDFAPWSYGHWLGDSLPRWLLAKQAGLTEGDFDHIYLPSPDTPSTRYLIQALGISREKLVTMVPDCDLEIASLVATAFVGAPGTVSSLAREMALQLHPVGLPRKRLYLARTGYRRNFKNHEQVREILEKHGFETCDPSCDPDTIKKCSEAGVILGIEGSQCLNALFAPSGGKLIVVAPDGFHPLPYMQTLAGAAGLSLSIVGARTTGIDDSCILEPRILEEVLAGL